MERARSALAGDGSICGRDAASGTVGVRTTFRGIVRDAAFEWWWLHIDRGDSFGCGLVDACGSPFDGGIIFTTWARGGIR